MTQQTPEWEKTPDEPKMECLESYLNGVKEGRKAGRVAALKEVRENIETRLKFLAQTDNAASAVGCLQSQIYRHNPPDLSLSKIEALGKAVVLNDLLSSLEPKKDV